MRTFQLNFRGFTLIEVMISIAIGSLIVYTSFVSIRVASQAAITSNQISRENSLLRAGYYEAQNQLDFWTNLDDPEDLSRQKLRQTDSGPYGPLGLPFTPMRQVFRGVTTTAPRFAQGGTVSGQSFPGPIATGNRAVLTQWETDIGWDPTYAWSVHDPRTWYRGNIADKAQEWIWCGQYRDPQPSDPTHETQIWKLPIPPDSYPQALFGRYAIFSNIDRSPRYFSYTIKTDCNPDPTVLSGTAQKVALAYDGDAMHNWYPRQVHDLMRAMGYAGLCEYLPPNAIHSYYKSTDPAMSFWGGGDTTPGGIFKLCVDPGFWYGTMGNFCNDAGWVTTARGIYMQTYMTSFSYINPDSTPGTIGDLRWSSYRKYHSDFGATNGPGSNELREMLSSSAYYKSLMTYRPEYWPDVQVAVGRWVKNAHHVALAKILMVNPLNGSQIELSWSGLGTTLRGARQQRDPVKGWASWDNSGSPTTIGETLDSP